MLKAFIKTMLARYLTIHIQILTSHTQIFTSLISMYTHLGNVSTYHSNRITKLEKKEYRSSRKKKKCIFIATTRIHYILSDNER